MIPNIQKTHCVRYSYLTWVYSAWVSQAHTSVPKNQESEQKIAVKIPTTYNAPVLRHFCAGAKVAQIIYPALTLRHFRASQYFFI